ncbi:MAG TPA: Jag N-terminal domain-containing protein, partial [Thermomicrobiales bacterium]|nr:Jag N-terminal domain-containing protein [Thermomicrobiales bacterium]
MTSVEIQAVSVEEAVRLALEQLGRTPDEVDIEILSDAGPEEDAEALVRVTAKGMASQPVPRGSRATPGARRQPAARRVPGDRPSSRGTPPRERPAPRP